jgi:hypothetical protein
MAASKMAHLLGAVLDKDGEEFTSIWGLYLHIASFSQLLVL